MLLSKQYYHTIDILNDARFDILKSTLTKKVADAKKCFGTFYLGSATELVNISSGSLKADVTIKVRQRSRPKLVCQSNYDKFLFCLIAMQTK